MCNYFQFDAATITNLDTGAEFSRHPYTGDVRCFWPGLQRGDGKNHNTVHGLTAARLWQRLQRLAAASERPLYAEPVCGECGQPLSSADVDAGEAVCLECVAVLG